MKVYFDALNYTLANEDTAVEHAALRDGEDLVVSVAGSGARVLPLLARSPRELVCVDVSPAQLMLTELRVESVRALDHASFLGFWGYPRVAGAVTGAQRRALLDEMSLSTASRAFANELFFVV